MGIRFSLIYPTRHRPAFIGQALRFLERQGYQDFEVIVSDNYIDPVLSCEKVCRDSMLADLKYIRPPHSLSMVENWNHALQFVSGDYICYFTDKMFLLPGTLVLANACIETSKPDIVNWTDNSYTPTKFPDYFGQGLYEIPSPISVKPQFSFFNPKEELSRKGRAAVSRNEQDKSSYVRGKICFGAYRRELCERVADNTGALFHKISPDYTSMILGLSMAESAAEISRSGIVHVNTDLSNGGQGSIHDELALKFLNDLGNAEELISSYLVPGLYSSVHNAVSHDYLTLKKKFKLEFEFTVSNWLVYITEDLDDPLRVWSSTEVETNQRSLLQGFIDRLPQNDRRLYEKELAERRETNRIRARKRNLRKVIRSITPEPVVRIALSGLSRLYPNRPVPRFCSTIEDVLQESN